MALRFNYYLANNVCLRGVITYYFAQKKLANIKAKILGDPLLYISRSDLDSEAYLQRGAGHKFHKETILHHQRFEIVTL